MGWAWLTSRHRLRRPQGPWAPALGVCEDSKEIPWCGAGSFRAGGAAAHPPHDSHKRLWGSGRGRQSYYSTQGSSCGSLPLNFGACTVKVLDAWLMRSEMSKISPAAASLGAPAPSFDLQRPSCARPPPAPCSSPLPRSPPPPLHRHPSALRPRPHAHLSCPNIAHAAGIAVGRGHDQRCRVPQSLV